MQCPRCKCEMVAIGSCGIVDYEGRWESEAERFRCACGAMAFLAEAAPIDAAEEEAAVDGHHPLDMDPEREE
jgi:hypothetical protein